MTSAATIGTGDPMNHPADAAKAATGQEHEPDATDQLRCLTRRLVPPTRRAARERGGHQ